MVCSLDKRIGSGDWGVEGCYERIGVGSLGLIVFRVLGVISMIAFWFWWVLGSRDASGVRLLLGLSLASEQTLTLGLLIVFSLSRRLGLCVTVFSSSNILILLSFVILKKHLVAVVILLLKGPSHDGLVFWVRFILR